MITVAVEAGGRDLIQVSDDGHGMSRDDAMLAFERMPPARSEQWKTSSISAPWALEERLYPASPR